MVTLQYKQFFKLAIRQQEQYAEDYELKPLKLRTQRTLFHLTLKLFVAYIRGTQCKFLSISVLFLFSPGWQKNEEKEIIFLYVLAV